MLRFADRLLPPVPLNPANNLRSSKVNFVGFEELGFEPRCRSPVRIGHVDEYSFGITGVDDMAF